MESSDSGFWYSTIYAVTIGVYICALIWKVKKGHNSGSAIALVALGGPLFFPGYLGLLFLCCGIWLCYRRTLGTRDAKFLPMHGKAVLVTGCDSGFGHALAALLSSMGVSVFAGVLDENAAGAQNLRKQGCKELHVLQLDVTDRLQIEQAHQYIHTTVGEAGLWGLVNNAGFLGWVADGEIHPMSSYRHCIDVNFLAAVEMCQVFLPMLRRSRGRIVNVCSMGGEVPLPRYSAYGASKAALNLFSKVIRMELAGWGVKVAVIQPAGFRTNMVRDNGDWSQFQEEILNAISPDARRDYGEAYISSLQGWFSNMADQCSVDLSPVLNDICHALLSVSPNHVYTPGQAGWLFPFIYHVCPTVVSDILLTRLFKFDDTPPAGLMRN